MKLIHVVLYFPCQPAQINLRNHPKTMRALITQVLPGAKPVGVMVPGSGFHEGNKTLGSISHPDSGADWSILPPPFLTCPQVSVYQPQARKRLEIPSGHGATTWMNLEDITLMKIRQLQTYNYYMIPVARGTSSCQTHRDGK